MLGCPDLDVFLTSFARRERCVQVERSEFRDDL
jgi:hypothetical protein